MDESGVSFEKKSPMTMTKNKISFHLPKKDSMRNIEGVYKAVHAVSGHTEQIRLDLNKDEFFVTIVCHSPEEKEKIRKKLLHSSLAGSFISMN